MRSRFVAVALCTWSLCGLLAGCAVQEPNAAPAETPRAEQPAASEGLPQDSVFTRLRDEDGLRRLAQDMKEGKVPTSCIAFYDQGGSSSVVSVTSEDEVRAMYGLAGNVVVRGKVDADAAEAAGTRHFVSFARQDGSTVGLRFAGEGSLVTRDASYRVEGDAALWEKVRELQGKASQKGDVYNVAVVSDEDALVESCPTSAAAGETVRIATKGVLDVDLVVCVNGERLDSHGSVHEFAMPDRMALVEVFTEAYSFGGGS